MSGVIYCVTNLMNNKKYIGQTSAKDYDKYINCHFKNAKKNNDTRFFYKAIRKYGIKNFKYIILGHCKTKKELNESEKNCIAHFQSNNNIYGYNMTCGGDGGITRGIGKKHQSYIEVPNSIRKKILKDYKRGISITNLSITYKLGKKIIHKILIEAKIVIRTASEQSQKTLLIENRKVHNYIVIDDKTKQSIITKYTKDFLSVKDISLIISYSEKVVKRILMENNIIIRNYSQQYWANGGHY